MRAHRHAAVEDAARDGALRHRLPAPQPLRHDARHRSRRQPAPAHGAPAHGDRAAGRADRAQPRPPRRDSRARRRRVRRAARGGRTRGELGLDRGHAAPHRRRDPDRDRQLAVPPARRPLRRPGRRGLRHDPRPRPHPAVARRRRRRRDRLRVRLPVRGARHQDHGHRGARFTAWAFSTARCRRGLRSALEREGHQVLLGDAVLGIERASPAGRCTSR